MKRSGLIQPRAGSRLRGAYWELLLRGLLPPTRGVWLQPTCRFFGPWERLAEAGGTPEMRRVL